MAVIKRSLKSVNWRALGLRIFPAALSVVLALLIGSLFLLASGRDPIAAYSSLLLGCFRFTGTIYRNPG